MYMVTASCLSIVATSITVRITTTMTAATISTTTVASTTIVATSITVRITTTMTVAVSFVLLHKMFVGMSLSRMS